MAFVREDNNRVDLKSIKNMIGVLWGHPYHYFLDIYVVVF
jgi:hypothetical protein